MSDAQHPRLLYGVGARLRRAEDGERRRREPARVSKIRHSLISGAAEPRGRSEESVK